MLICILSLIPEIVWQNAIKLAILTKTKDRNVFLQRYNEKYSSQTIFFDLNQIIEKSNCVL